MSDSLRDQVRGVGARRGGLSATGIAEVLEAYSTQGGQLFGARLWAENPLTLTHVRWMDAHGAMVEAVRRPETDATLDDEERQVWIELALGFPAMHPSAVNSQAAWFPLNVSPQQAAGLAVRLARALASSHRSGYSDYDVSNHPTATIRTSSPASALGGPHRASTDAPGPSPVVPSFPPFPPFPPSGPSTFSPPPFSPPPFSPPPFSATSGAPARGANPPENFARGPIFDDGVSVIPSVEIELPGSGMPGILPASTRDFARDSAATFAHAVQSLPQARELRGWMRGGRMVLAVRLIMAPGAGVPTTEELNDAMQLLARVLARHTLPFARLAIADPGEWSQAQALTEV